MFGVRFTGNAWDRIPILTNGVSAPLLRHIDLGLRGVGGYLVDVLRRNILARGTILDAPFAPNARLTIRLKGSDRPLLHTGGLMNAVRFERVSVNLYTVGITDPMYARRGEFLEKGGMTEIDGRSVLVPARPWLSPLRQKQSVVTTAQVLFKTSVERFLRELAG